MLPSGGISTTWLPWRATRLFVYLCLLGWWVLVLEIVKVAPKHNGQKQRFSSPQAVFVGGFLVLYNCVL